MQLPVLLCPALRLQALLGGHVQQEPLVQQLAALLDKLHVAQDMYDISVPVLDPVFGADAVPHLLQGGDAGPKPRLVLVQHGLGNQVKAVLHHFLLGLVAQQAQRRLVDADDLFSVQGVAHHAAVHGGKQQLQNPALLKNLPLIAPLAGHVQGHPYRARNAAVHVVQGGFIRCQKQLAPAGLDHLVCHAGFPLTHDLPL